MGDGRFQWERAFFRDLPAGKPLRSYFALLILSVRPRKGTNFEVIAPVVSRPQYGKVAAFMFFFNFSISSRSNGSADFDA
jgi:hypothetical protein